MSTGGTGAESCGATVPCGGHAPDNMSAGGVDAASGGRPWTTAKGFDQSAPISAIHRASRVGHPTAGRIWLAVNSQIRQDAGLNELIWGVAESIAELSRLFELAPGDLLFTGTPAGVGPLEPGDEVTGGIEGIDEIQITIR